jgi:hypothetical protein
VVVLIYQGDNDYGNDKAARSLICRKFAVGGAIDEINLAKELLKNRCYARHQIMYYVHKENRFMQRCAWQILIE